MTRKIRPVVLVSVCVLCCAGARAGLATEQTMSMQITSSAYPDHGQIPPKFTCKGSDTSPPLAWSGVPPGAKSLALVMDDPDAPDPAAPQRTWVHWVLYNLPPTTAALAEGAGNASVELPARAGLNDWERTGYGGPCPPIGRHRYYVKLYALDVVLPELKPPTKAALQQAMQGHVIAEAVLLGTFEK